MKKLKDPKIRSRGSSIAPRELAAPRPGPLPAAPGLEERHRRLQHFSHPAAGVRHTIEFRDPSWYADDVLALLRAHDVALCLHDMRGSATGRERGGVRSCMFDSTVPPAAIPAATRAARLEPWAAWLTEQRRQGRTYTPISTTTSAVTRRVDALALRRSDGELE